MIFSQKEKAKKSANPWGTRFFFAFCLLVFFTKLLFCHGLDPLPVPDEMEKQANHHDIAAVRMDIRDDSFDGTSIAETGKKVKVEHDARDHADKTAEKEQQIEVKILFHRGSFFLSEELGFAFSLAEPAENQV